ncbi:MAG: PQQ-binding-like beta-propeller repeat protein [Planctomycetota bacterium]
MALSAPSIDRPRRIAVLGAFLVLGIAMGLPAQGGTVEPDAPASDLAYALPTVDEVHLASFADFLELVADGKWSRAFRSIGTQLEAPPEGFLAPDSTGFAFSWREGVWRSLAALPAPGRRAFRLFHDPKARKLLAEARGREGNERRAELERVFFSYFPTASGDDAASDLAALDESEGRWARAAFFLSALLEHHPDTDLETLPIRARLARCHALSGREDRLEEVLGRILDRDRESEIVLDDFRGTGEEFAAEMRRRRASLVRGQGTTALDFAVDAAGAGELGAQVAWKVELRAYARNQERPWETPVDAENPDVVVDGGTIFVNHLGEVRAIDAATGEEIWKAGRTPGQLSAAYIGRCFVAVAGDRVLVTSPPISLTGAGDELVRVLCRDRKDGSSVWNTRRTRDDRLEGLSVLARPLVVGDELVLLAKRKGLNAIRLIAISLDEGDFRWEVELGTPVEARGNMNFFGWSNGDQEGLQGLRPVLAVVGGEVLVCTDGGAVLGVSLESHRLEWAFTYDVGPPAPHSPSSLVVQDDRLYFCAQGQKRLFALDLVRREVTRRAVCAGAAVVGLDARRVYLFGEELQAYDRRRLRSLAWSRGLERGGSRRDVVIGRESLFVYTSTGLYEWSLENGDRVRCVRKGLPRLGDASVYRVGDLFIGASPVGLVAFSLAPVEELGGEAHGKEGENG